MSERSTIQVTYNLDDVLVKQNKFCVRHLILTDSFKVFPRPKKRQQQKSPLSAVSTTKLFVELLAIGDAMSAVGEFWARRFQLALYTFRAQGLHILSKRTKPLDSIPHLTLLVDAFRFIRE